MSSFNIRNSGAESFAAPSSSRILQFLLGEGVFPQILFALLFGILLFLILFSVESLIDIYNHYFYAKTALIPHTITDGRSIVFRQDPTDPKASMILPSDNERTGVEFTYSFFLFVEPGTFDAPSDTVVKLKQVFYKGYTRPFPLLGPGVFIRSDENTMRIFMNSYKNWYSYVDVKNIPLQKWFHCAIVYRANNLEVFINGNMTGRISMEDTYPYQNYQNLVVFGKANYNSGDKKYTPAGAIGDVQEKYLVSGSMSGQISRLTYSRYAMTFSEIQADVNAGPSSTVDMPGNQAASSYIQNILTDTWYTAGE